jgi:hypothetical protein
MITSFALPDRRVLRVDLYPRVTARVRIEDEKFERRFYLYQTS